MQRHEAMTIRFPGELIAKARQVKSERESLNDLVVGAVEREVRRRAVVRAHEAIARVRDSVRARTGAQPDSGPLIRALREGDSR